jgi:hypothetical protein
VPKGGFVPVYVSAVLRLDLAVLEGIFGAAFDCAQVWLFPG